MIDLLKFNLKQIFWIIEQSSGEILEWISDEENSIYKWKGLKEKSHKLNFRLPWKFIFFVVVVAKKKCKRAWRGIERVQGKNAIKHNTTQRNTQTTLIETIEKNMGPHKFSIKFMPFANKVREKCEIKRKQICERVWLLLLPGRKQWIEYVCVAMRQKFLCPVWDEASAFTVAANK